MIPRLYFDLETIPDQRPGAKEKFASTIQPPASMKKADTIAEWEATKRPAAIEKAWRKTSLDGGSGKVATASWAFGEEPVLNAYSDDWGSTEGERETIRAMFASVDDWLARKWSHGNSIRPQVIGHNILGFDLRFLFQRCVVLNIKAPLWLPVNAKPWDTDVVFDTMVAWAGHRDYVRMNVICEALGIPLKGSEFDDPEDEIDGAQVWDAVSAGRIADVVRYCDGDVERTRLMHKRMVFEL